MITEEQKEKDRELEGKEVIFCRDLEEFGSSVQAVISGLDYDIGLTIQNKLTGEYLLCSTGPSSPMAKRIDNYDIKAYEAAYLNIVRMAREGCISAQELFDILTPIKRPGRWASAKTCAFAQ